MNQQEKNSTVAIRFFSVLVFVLLAKIAVGQCVSTIDSFQPGEKLVYDAYYNWGFIWIKVGEAVFEVRDSTINNTQHYHFKGYGGSSPGYDWIFKVREDFNVLWDKETQKATQFSRKSTEGKFEVENYYSYDFDSQKLYTDVESTKRPHKLDTLAINNCSVDMLSAIYWARSLDYNKYRPDQKIPFHAVIDNEAFDLYFRYLGKEEIKLKAGARYNSIVFQPYLVEGTVFDGGEDMKVYVTDDKNKIPLIVEAKIMVGSVKAILREKHGIRHPVEAVIDDD